MNGNQVSGLAAVMVPAMAVRTDGNGIVRGISAPMRQLHDVVHFQIRRAIAGPAERRRIAAGFAVAGRAKQLEIESAVAGGLKVVIPQAALKNLPLVYSRTNPRFSDVELVSLPSTGAVGSRSSA